MALIQKLFQGEIFKPFYPLLCAMVYIKTKKRKGKPKPRLYVKKSRFRLSAVVLFSLVCLVIIVGSVLGSVQFAKEEEAEGLFNETEEPIVPLVPEIKEKTFVTDLEIDDLLWNGTYFIRIVNFPTAQFNIELERLGRREGVQVEKKKYPKGY